MGFWRSSPSTNRETGGTGLRCSCPALAIGACARGPKFAFFGDFESDPDPVSFDLSFFSALWLRVEATAGA